MKNRALGMMAIAVLSTAAACGDSTGGSSDETTADSTASSSTPVEISQESAVDSTSIVPPGTTPADSPDTVPAATDTGQASGDFCSIAASLYAVDAGDDTDTDAEIFGDPAALEEIITKARGYLDDMSLVAPSQIADVVSEVVALYAEVAAAYESVGYDEEEFGAAAASDPGLSELLTTFDEVTAELDDFIFTECGIEV
jgi:ABC-type glycerol-3-phosphate transport system substrate-binding protein